MLTVQEALLFQAVQDEKDRLAAQQAAGTAGAIGGAAVGAVGGQIPHMLGKSLARLRGKSPVMMRPGARMAGGLTGMILGGALGAGTAAVMKQNSPAAQMLGKIQGQGGDMSELDKIQLSRMLGQIYNEPSQMM